jgi:TRAP-type C4-dicarboxylate transport system permease small subunit
VPRGLNLGANNQNNMFKSVLDGGGRIATWFARAASVGVAWMMIVTLIDVLGRNLFNSPIIGSIEFTETSLGMTVFLGMGYVTFDRSHITVDVLTTMLPKKLRDVFLVFTGAIAVVFIGFATWRMILQVYDRFIEGLVTTLWTIPMWPVTAVMTAGLALMFLLLVLQLIQDTGRLVKGEAPPETVSESHEPGTTEYE